MAGKSKAERNKIITRVMCVVLAVAMIGTIVAAMIIR